MKTISTLAGVAATALLLSGCASYHPRGMIYTDVKGDSSSAQYNSDVSAEKTGRACAQSVLGIVATGDMSVQTAVQRGNISKIRSVNYKTHSILGFLGDYCTIVKGE